MAAYCRVSTDHEEQLGSFANQVEYYAELICSHPGYELAGIFSDEGISGTGTKHRPGFQRLIQACEEGKVDLVLTKSISRFARNTQDCLRYARRLQQLGIGIRFEKEGIYTLDASGELLFTILSSLAQEESRNISENTAWGIRSLFARGVPHMNASCLLGYDRGADGRLVVNRAQAKVVRRVFRDFLEGWSASEIARRLNAAGVPGVRGEARWYPVSITRILRNEKYKGDLLMQKTYTESFLTKKQRRNNGELAQYLVEDAHEPIVSREEWEAAQLELARQDAFRERHRVTQLGSRTADPLHARVFCACCGARYLRLTGPRARVQWWRCVGASRAARDTAEEGLGGQAAVDASVPAADEPACTAPRVAEDALHAALAAAWNQVVGERAELEPGWREAERTGDVLQRLRARQMRELASHGAADPLRPALVRMVLEELIVHDPCSYEVHFLDGTVRRVQTARYYA